jgi:hypothetical protein
VRGEKYIPQFVAVAVCAVRGHRQARYAARHEGIQVVVYTCRCGREQKTHALPANRAIRRGLRKRHR